MKVIEEIEERYYKLVEYFLPHRIHQAAEIGYQIELFKIDAEEEGCIIENLRLKEDGDVLSTTKYEEKQILGKGEKVDDLYLVSDGKDIYFGYNLQKI